MAEVVVTPDAKGDTQAHIDAMIAKAKGKAEAADPETPETPPATPEGATQETPEGAPEDGAQETPEGAAQETPDAEGAEEAVQQAGLDMDDLTTKLTENGQLDASDYEALEKVGIKREMVDMYVEGQKALGEQMVSRMHAVVGGEETFNSLFEWAGDNLNDAEITAFNDTIDNGNEAAVKMALQGLHMRYKSDGNDAPNLIGGDNVPNSTDVFRSTSELTAAMGDRRYATDPAYRADVEAKLARSSIFNRR